MKKKILIVLLTVFMLSVLSVTAFANATGDVDGNGKITAMDARTVLRYSAKLMELTEEQIVAADVDASGVVNASDARMILRVSAKLDISFEDRDLDEHIIEEGVLNVAVALDSKPFSYTENGELKGIDVSLAKEIAETAGLELRLHPMPYDDMINAVNNGECDLAAINRCDNEVTNNASATAPYYSNMLAALVRTSSGFVSAEDVKSNSSAKVGVLNNSIDKYMVENEIGADRVTGFSTCAEATDALREGKIDAFVTYFRYAVNIEIEFGDIETLSEPYFISDDHVFISAFNNVSLSSKVDKILTADKKDECINKYNNYDMDCHLSLKHSSIKIAPGGTACLEVNAKSFFFTIPHIYLGGFEGAAQITHVNGKTYLILKFYPQTRSQKLEIYLPNEKAIIWLDIIVDPNAPKNYILDDNSSTPDFGAYTRTRASNVMIDEAMGIIAYTYSSEDLYNSGITDTSMLDGYFNALEAAGYKYMGYMEEDNTLIAMYYNEAIGRAFSYVEVYDSYGYVQEIGVGFNLFDLPDA